MPSEQIVLEGCAPKPLAGYLKALGVFRLVATQADKNVRGWWENERFHLATALSRRELVAFLLETYRPTPVVSPWNAGSGFYYREEKTQEKDAVTGKLTKTGVRNQPTEATRALDGVLASRAPRLEPYRQAIGRAKEELVALGLDTAPGDVAKAELIRRLRSRMPDASLDWIDAAATVTQVDVVFPPLLGSGGNDGNLDFSTTVVQRIADLIDFDTGNPTEASPTLLAASIYGEVARTECDMAISQFTPGSVGAPNSGTGFSGNSTGNGWDIVLGLEGAVLMATALVRRIETNDGAASFPFMISRRGVFGAGAGSIAPADENARGEFWAPVWGRGASFPEILGLFREGRAVVNRATAGNALDFAQAVGRLGVDRGIGQFERYGFEQRYGNMYLGVPLGRRKVEANPHADLIADLTRGNWLGRVRSAVRGKGMPASLLTLGRQLDEALFRVTGSSSAQAVQDALQAIGALALEAGRRPKLGESLPPPRLSVDWLDDADDGSHAFAIARALATLDAVALPADEGTRFRMPFRRHLAPLNVRDAERRRDEWADTTEAMALAVWTGRDALGDMVAVLGRRLVEAERRAFVRGKDNAERTELPLAGLGLSLAAVTALFADELDSEIERIAALATGLAWVDRRRRSRRAAEEIPPPVTADENEVPGDVEAGEEGNDDGVGKSAGADEAGSSTVSFDKVPVGGFAFAALKPLFDPKGVAVPRPWDTGKPRRYGDHDKRKRKFVNPVPLVRLLEAGRVDEALTMAARIARGAGLSVPFAAVDNSKPSRGLWPSKRAARLAAALLVPLSDSAIEALADRAYPVTTRDQEAPQ
jgi:CRISPR-associated protein Csx17